MGYMWEPYGIYSHGIFQVGFLWDLHGLLFEGWKLKQQHFIHFKIRHYFTCAVMHIFTGNII